jgi:hypothetical protein
MGGPAFCLSETRIEPPGKERVPRPSENPSAQTLTLRPGQEDVACDANVTQRPKEGLSMVTAIRTGCGFLHNLFAYAHQGNEIRPRHRHLAHRRLRMKRPHRAR